MSSRDRRTSATSGSWSGWPVPPGTATCSPARLCGETFSVADAVAVVCQEHLRHAIEGPSGVAQLASDSIPKAPTGDTEVGWRCLAGASALVGRHF